MQIVAIVLSMILQATQPATAPTVDPQAQTLLDEVSAAYAKLNSLQLAGESRLDLDAPPLRENRSAGFTASFAAPNRFRHEVEGDALLVGTGTKAFLYVPSTVKFNECETPPTRSTEELADPITNVLKRQNPSLYLALSADAAAAIEQDGNPVSLDEDTMIGDVTCKTLHITGHDQDLLLLIDPATNLIRQARIDLRKLLQQRGIEDIKASLITIDYTRIALDENIPEQTFAWKPPADATLARANVAALVEADPDALVGRPAPAFKLKDLQGNAVSSADLRGKVVVLDFFATWCGPCRASLPQVQKLRDEMGGDAIQFFAINLREDAETAQQFVDQTRLTLSVLLDTDGAVAEKFGVGGIPHSVVIDQKGVVRNVMVGFGPDGEKRLREALQKTLEN